MEGEDQFTSTFPIPGDVEILLAAGYTRSIL